MYQQATTEKVWTKDEIQKRVDELGFWFHNLDLQGVQTAPNHFLGDYPNIKWQGFAHAIPKNLEGKTVLDIGCNAGFYSMEMKRRGASRVVGIDSEPMFLNQARFAAEVNGLEIEFYEIDVYDVAKLGHKFDFVVFMGVLYHLRHPLLALDLIHDHVAGDAMLFQSMQRGSKEVAALEEDYHFWREDIFDERSYPKLHFVEHQYAHDQSNWWIPNRACVEAMLRSAGFEITEHPEEEVYLCKRAERPYNFTGSGAVYPASKGGSLG